MSHLARIDSVISWHVHAMRALVAARETECDEASNHAAGIRQTVGCCNKLLCYHISSACSKCLHEAHCSLHCSNIVVVWALTHITKTCKVFTWGRHSNHKSQNTSSNVQICAYSKGMFVGMQHILQSHRRAAWDHQSARRGH